MADLPGVRDLLCVLAALLYTLQTIAAVRLPSDLSEELYCAGCEAVTKELHNKLTSKRSTESLEVRVVEALETICEDKYYKSYDFTPAKMVRACKYLLEEYDEDMEQILIGHIRMNDSQKALDQRICHMLSKACLGLRVTKKKQDPRETDEYKNFDFKIPDDAKYVKPVSAPSHDKDEL